VTLSATATTGPASVSSTGSTINSSGGNVFNGLAGAAGTVDLIADGDSASVNAGNIFAEGGNATLGTGGAGGVVTLSAAGTTFGSVAVNGSINTSGGFGSDVGGNAGNVILTAAGDTATIDVNNNITAMGGGANGITATPATGGMGGTVSISAAGTTSGSVFTNGTTITTSGGSVLNGIAGDGGDVTLAATGTTITITAGGITTVGGNANTAGAGGDGGNVTIPVAPGSSTVAITTNGLINTSGGDGDDEGGNAGNVTINQGGSNVVIYINNDIIAQGGDANTGTAGMGGTVSVTPLGIGFSSIAATSITINTSGGNVISGTAGNAGDVTLHAAGTSAHVTSGTVTAEGGMATTGAGGMGGNITLSASGTSAGSVTVFGTLRSSGGDGDVLGGDAGTVNLIATGTTTASIDVNGFIFADGGDGTLGTGGAGGVVTISATGTGVSSVSTTGITIMTTGGDGLGNAGNGGGVMLTASGAMATIASGSINTMGGDADTGGLGGNISISANGTAFGSVSTTGSINSSGNFGGSLGGDAGTVTITADGVSSFITVNSSITAEGGDATTGIAGNGNTVDISIGGTATTASVTVNGMISTGGGDGATSGGMGGLVTMFNSAGPVHALGTISTIGGNATSEGPGGHGGDLSISADFLTLGTVDLSGGNAAGVGDNNGGDAGDLTLVAKGTTQTIFLSGDITANPGTPTGAGVGGAGSTMTFTGEDVVLDADGLLTIDAAAAFIDFSGVEILADGAGESLLINIGGGLGGTVTLGLVGNDSDNTTGAGPLNFLSDLEIQLGDGGTASANGDLVLTDDITLESTGGSGFRVTGAPDTNRAFRDVIVDGTITINTNGDNAGIGGVVDLGSANLMADGGGQTLTIDTDGGAVIFGNVDNNDDDGDGTTAGDSDITGFTGEHLSELSVLNGPVQIDGNVVWFYPDGVSLGTSISGNGNVEFAAPSSGNPNVTIGGNLLLPNLTGFFGHMVIGGTIIPFVNDMSTITPFDNSVDILATTLTVNTPLTLGAGANLTLLATDTLTLNQDINIGSGPGGGELTLGVINASLGTGDIIIDGVGTRTITAGQGYFVATGGIQNTLDLILSFGGPAQILEVITVDPLGSFNPASAGQVGSVADPTLEFINIINALGASDYPVGPYDPNDPSPANLAAAQATGLAGAIIAAGGGFGSINIFNATAQLIALEELGFIDTGLFEEDLTLFGIIGYGIALALAQCEEIEGCAPNVTLEELNELIAQLEARIAELDRRCEEGDEASCELLVRYKEELGNFLSYREELQKYLTAADEELEDEFTDEFGEEAPAGETNIETLARMLETIKTRIAWLESLRTQPEERARLGQSIGIELTLEVLEEIIQGAITEAQFIEKQIKLLQEGTQALADPVFTAEVRDYSSIQHIGYGPAILNLDGQKNMNEWVY